MNDEPRKYENLVLKRHFMKPNYNELVVFKLVQGVKSQGGRGGHFSWSHKIVKGNLNKFKSKKGLITQKSNRNSFFTQSSLTGWALDILKGGGKTPETIHLGTCMITSIFRFRQYIKMTFNKLVEFGGTECSSVMFTKKANMF